LGSDRSCLGVTLILKDITRLKELEAQTQRAQKLQAMGEMAVQLAHEIRNPLGSIELFASLLGSELEGNAEQKNWADQIVTGVKFLNTIVTNMLTFTRSSKLQSRHFDLLELVEETLSFIEPVLVKRDIHLERPSRNNRILVEADLDLLRQMLVNLVMNALQAMPEKGKLSLRISTDCADLVVIEVEDTGIGIPPENMKRIFDPFFTTSEKGTGLGLALVHQIVEKHQGSVAVRSEFGKGTLFTLSLPIKAMEARHAQ
jgi:signal transduction histidine kinase